MRLLIYEWVTGGGLVGHQGPLPESLLREGLAMVQAAAADAAGVEGVAPALLRDLRLPSLSAEGGEIVEVASRSEHDAAIQELASEADAVLVIAPETDGVLLKTVQRMEASGARLLSPGAELVAVAGDKQRTGDALQAAGVPAPTARRLEPDQRLPSDFPYPAVLKPLDGAGSQDTHVVAHAGEQIPAYAWPRRLERFLPGTPASVAVLGVVGVVGDDPIALPPCRQRISIDGRLSYQGGSTPLAPRLAERASQLAIDAAHALPAFVGLVGIDLVLGDDPDGSLDAVIEVNPRLTTSYVGLRRIVHGGLIGPMLAAAAGKRPTLEIDSKSIAWDADGSVYWT